MVGVLAKFLRPTACSLRNRDVAINFFICTTLVEEGEVVLPFPLKRTAFFRLSKSKLVKGAVSAINGSVLLN